MLKLYYADKTHLKGVYSVKYIFYLTTSNIKMISVPEYPLSRVKKTTVTPKTPELHVFKNILIFHCYQRLHIRKILANSDDGN